tara:strand:- start:3104 stop:3976 length:873 start_codon:yes stop_codon:yes gene_type:complete
MVSCQWRLTSGARAGQACGKGKKVFCKTHESKAKYEVNRLFGHWRNNPMKEYLSRLTQEADEIFAVANGREIRNARYSYYGDTGSGVEKYSASWIAQGNALQNLGLSNYGRGADAMFKITDPRIVSQWLEQQLSIATVRGGEIFPQKITGTQLQGIDNVAAIFNRRMDEGKNFYQFYQYATNSQYDKPLPFLQNRRFSNYSKEVQITNTQFIMWLQGCINYAPDYTAAWDWFFPTFTKSMIEHLDVIKRGYDIEAIKKDLSQLTRAYRVDVREEEKTNLQLNNTNRYRRQ